MVFEGGSKSLRWCFSIFRVWFDFLWVWKWKDGNIQMFICDICYTECILWLWAKRQLKVWVMKVNSQMAFCAALELFANHVRPVQYEYYFDVCLWTDEIASSEQRKPGSNFATDKNRHIRIHPEAPRIDFYLWNPKGVLYILSTLFQNTRGNYFFWNCNFCDVLVF